MIAQPKLSILVPVYNVEKYLAQCLSSLVGQSLQDIEIICINDGSTDGSLAILQRFAKKDSRIAIIDKENTGYGDSMNKALKRAHGEYVSILEPDDWIEENAYKIMYQAAKKANADLVKTNFYRTRTNPKTGLTEDFRTSEVAQKETIKPSDKREVFQFMPAIWSAIYKKSFLIDNNINFLPTPGASYQDLSFSFKVWTLAEKAVLLPDAFVHYRIDNEGSSINNPGKINCVVEEYAEIETFLCERGFFPKFGETMNAAKFRNYHWNFQRLDKKLAKEFYQTWRRELVSAWDEGLLKQSNFSQKDWLALKTIIKHPRIAYFVLNLRKRLKHFA